MWRAVQKACVERFSDGGGRGGIAEFFGAGSGGRMRGCTAWAIARKAENLSECLQTRVPLCESADMRRRGIFAAADCRNLGRPRRF